MNGGRIAGAAAVVVVITVVSKVLGFGREAALAAVFGASGATDAYLVAMIIPALLFGVVGSTITTVGIPLFAEYIHDPARRGELPGLLWRAPSTGCSSSWVWRWSWHGRWRPGWCACWRRGSPGSRRS
ncbi:MAG: hypothetical protein AB1441_10005 [Bacillota bacterium]